MFNVMNIVLFAVLIFILLLDMKVAKKGTYIEKSLSLDACKALQGFFGLLIIIHHIYTFLNTRGYMVEQIQWSARIGVYLIGFFFFCSGYGLMTSLRIKKDYLEGFVVKRVCIVLVPFFISNYAYMFVEQLKGVRYTPIELICSFFGLLLQNTQMWFAVEIMLLYLLFSLLFKYIKNEKLVIIIITALVMIMTIFSMLVFDKGKYINWFVGEWWYNTTPLFILGMIVAKKQEKLRQFTLKYYWLILCIAVILLVIFGTCARRMLQSHGYWTMLITDKLITYLVQLPSVILFELVVILVMMKIKVGNRLLSFLGKFALEELLISGTFLNGFIFLLDRYGFVCYLCLSFIATMFLSILLYRLKRIILELR